MRRRLPWIAILLAACSGEPLQPPPPRVPVAATSTPPTPGLRLPGGAAPVRYAATLTLVPSAETFEGAVDIDLDLREPTSFLWLNASELTVASASLAVGGRKIGVRAAAGGEDHLGFAFDEQVQGAARLSVTYRGAVSGKDDRGVFREREGGDDYLFSQFENIEARRAFPCFDEPSFKVPWQLTLRVREGDVALSNTPVVSEAKLGGGLKEVRFAETKPLPSYLVAFAVGPFAVVDAGKIGAGKTPLRVVTPRGREARAAFAARTTPELFARLEAYFGIPYPYEKLDLVAVPQLVSFGAMENAGLITFAENVLLAREEEQTLAFERSFSAFAAHEMAHQWFGNLVTMAFWDDVWLNEAFASWMEDKTLAPWKPEARWDVSRAGYTARAMRTDGLRSARKVREAVRTKDDIQNAFDEITYSKGAAVITMFEAYVGPERFRRGVTRYLREHAHGNATSAQFLAALAAEAGAEIAPAMSTFLDQPGVPLVRGELRCEGGAASVALSQRRYLPLGSAGQAEGLWSIPVCVRWEGQGEPKRACTLLDKPAATLSLGQHKACPSWVMLDADAAGYYHAGVTGQALGALLSRGYPRLQLGEKLSVIRDLGALAASSDLPAGEVLGYVPALLSDPSPEVLEGALALATRVRDAEVPPALRPGLARYVQKTFGERARAVGWTAKAGEDDRVRLLRPTLLPVVSDRGGDPALLAEARALAERWLRDPAAVSPDLVDSVLWVAASRGDRALFDRLVALVRATKDEAVKRRAVRALASFRDPALARASLALFLGDDLDPRLGVDLLFQDPHVVAVVFEFLQKNFDAVVAKTPNDLRATLPALLESFCDGARRAEVEAFFKDRVAKLTGAPRALSRALETITLCEAQAKAEGPSLSAFLAKL